MSHPIGWTPVDIRIVTNDHGRATLIDRDGNILLMPVDITDPEQFAQIGEWLRGYLLDPAGNPPRHN